MKFSATLINLCLEFWGGNQARRIHLCIFWRGPKPSNAPYRLKSDPNEPRWPRSSWLSVRLTAPLPTSFHSLHCGGLPDCWTSWCVV